MRKLFVLVMVLVLFFIVGCVAKQIQKEEVPVVKNQSIEDSPVKDVSVEEVKPPVLVPEEPVAVVEPPKFVSGMNCSGGLFNFKINNIADENLSITKVYMHIKAKLFFPTCDVMVLESGKSTDCAQRYYTNIVGGAPVKIEAKIGNDIYSFIETVNC